ncbi:hypothetical protein TNCV_3359751 [Trichonephila clavipes]|nr:hypothetical protein TNCV_3359751 [Trichonephila clavipes]
MSAASARREAANWQALVWESHWFASATMENWISFQSCWHSCWRSSPISFRPYWHSCWRSIFIEESGTGPPSLLLLAFNPTSDTNCCVFGGSEMIEAEERDPKTILFLAKTVLHKL